MFPIDILRWPGGTIGKVLQKSEAFEHKANGFAKTEIAVVRAFWQQKRLQRFLEPSDKAVQELNKQNLLLESTCRNWGYTGAPEEPAEYPEGATEKQKQDLSQYVTAAQQLWSKVQGRTHAREHILKFMAIKLWNQLGVLQEVQGRFPQEVELDAADTAFLAAILDVIEAYGQSQKELMGIVVDNADKKRREAQDQVDDVNKKWQDAQDTCDDYKGKLEHAESTNAAHVKEIARVQADNQSAQQSRQDAECRAAAMLEEKNRLLGQVSDLEQERKQLQEDKEHLQEDKEHLQEGVNDTAKYIKEIARLQAENQSTQQSWKDAECRAAAMVHENHTLLAQVSSSQTEKTQLQEEKRQLQEDASHSAKCSKAKDAELEQQLQAAGALETDLRAQLIVLQRQNAHLRENAQMQEQRQAADGAVSAIKEEVQQDLDDSAAQPQMGKAAKKKAKKQRKCAMQVPAVTKASPEAPSPMDGASSAPAPTSGAELQVTTINEDNATLGGRGKEPRGGAPVSPSEQGEARPEVPSVPSGSSVTGDIGIQSPTPASVVAAAPKLTKGQKKKAKRQQKAAMQLTGSSPEAPSPMDGASSAPATTSGAELQADSTDLRQELKAVKDVAASDAVMHSTEAASLKEELKVVKGSVSASEARNAELQTKLESALAEVAAVKANSKPPKVYNINANGSSTFVPDSSHASSKLHTHADLPPSQAAPSELDQGPVDNLQKQVPGVQQEGEAVAVAKEMCDAQLKKKDAELKLLKKRFAIPTYVKRQGWIWGNSIGQGRNGSLCPVGNPDVPNTVLKQGSPSELEHEAGIMHALRHPNVVQSFGLILAKGPDGVKTHRLVLEHMKCSLEDIMKTRRLTVKEMVIGFYQLTSGLDHTHVRRIVDQDVHRGNVLISKGDGSWKKGDLGSAARCQRDDGEWNRIDPKDCRVAFGSESPDLAAMLIDRNFYVPLPAFDMFAVGLLILEVLGGQRPDDHCAVLRDPVYVSEAQRGVRDPVGLPGQRLHMEYLAKHVGDKASYVKKISLPTPGVDSPALEEDEKAPYQMLLKVMKDCLSTTREDRPAAFRVAYALFKAANDAKWL